MAKTSLEIADWNLEGMGVEQFRISDGKGVRGGGVKMFMLSVVGYGYFLESRNESVPLLLKVSVINYDIRLTCFASPNCSLSLSSYG